MVFCDNVGHPYAPIWQQSQKRCGVRQSTPPPPPPSWSPLHLSINPPIWTLIREWPKIWFLNPKSTEHCQTKSLISRFSLNHFTHWTKHVLRRQVPFMTYLMHRKCRYQCRDFVSAKPGLHLTVVCILTFTRMHAESYTSLTYLFVPCCNNHFLKHQKQRSFKKSNRKYQGFCWSLAVTVPLLIKQTWSKVQSFDNPGNWLEIQSLE